jgi:hypothetical protein
VFCVVRRTVTIIPDRPLVEFTVMRGDDLAEIGPTDLVERDLAFAAAMGLRASLSASEAPAIWCVVRRRVAIVPDRQTLEHSVVRCGNLAGIGAAWELVEDDLDFTEGGAARQPERRPGACDLVSDSTRRDRRQHPVSPLQRRTLRSTRQCGRVRGLGGRRA